MISFIHNYWNNRKKAELKNVITRLSIINSLVNDKKFVFNFLIWIGFSVFGAQTLSLTNISKFCLQSTCARGVFQIYYSYSTKKIYCKMIALSNQLQFIGTDSMYVRAPHWPKWKIQRIWKMNLKWTWDVSGVYSKQKQKFNKFQSVWTQNWFNTFPTWAQHVVVVAREKFIWSNFN